MAPTPFTFLLRYSFPSQNPHFRLQFSSLIVLKGGPFSSSLICRSISGGRSIRSFSTFPSTHSQPDPLPPKCSDPKSTLSARMSFVFDQIEAIERERSGKDEALQRIRSWREQKRNTQAPDSQSGLPGSSELTPETSEKKKDNIFATKEVELVHPWPEWIELMERLLQQNYFDHRRNEEDQMLLDNSSDEVGLSGFVEEGFDFTRDWITVRNACINFGRDRFDILRSLSRKDIQILVGHGCPSTDTKVVFSAKVLRKHAHLDEGDVCSSCSLRSSCSRAFLLTRKEDEARTLDIMRMLLTFGFEPVSGSVENKPVLKLKSVKTVVRKLLHEVVKLSAVPIDPNLPPPVIKKPPPKVKQPPPPPKRRVGRDDIEMKKGDWLCPKCDFMNFAKNTVCLQCDAKRPKRQLLPGEWECPECNFLNYRRNMVCFHCEHKRPPDEFMENQTQAKPRGPRTRLERAASIPGVSGAWNFDFDDNESDGADVAAFEFADPPRMGEDSPWDGQDYKANSRGFEDDSCDNIGAQEDQERGRYSACNRMKPSLPVHGTGFDDFDEEDDVDNYELEIPNKNSKQDISSMNSSGVGGLSEFEDSDDSDQSTDTHLRTNSRACNKPSRSVQGRAAFSGSDDDGQEFDSDSELSAHPSLKSSHIADSRHRTSGRGGSGPCRGLSFGSDSDDDLGLNSDFDEDEGEEDMGLTSRQAKGRKQTSNRKGFRRENSDSEDGHLFGSESDDDDRPRSQKNKMRGNNAGQREEEDMGLTSRQAKGRKQTSNRKGFRRENSDSEDEHLFGSESDDDDRPRSQKNKMRGNNAGPKRRGSTFAGQDRSGSGRDSRFRVNDMMGDRRKQFPDVDRDGSFGNSRRYGRGSQGDGFGYRPDERSNKFSGRSERTRNFDGRSNELSGRSERTRNFDGRSNEFSGRSERTRNFDGRSNKFSGSSERTRNFDGRSNKFSGSSERTRNFDGRSKKFSGSSERTRNFVDDKPHRRIIER